MSQSFIEVRNMSFAYGVRPILENISLTLPKGKVVAILGPSGTGKTTLFRLITGQLMPQKGEIFVDGQSIQQLSREQLFALRQRVGVLFQSGALLTDLSVYENVALPMREHTKLSESLIKKLVLMKLQAVGLRGAAHLMPAELSGGMSRRVALARAVALDPQIIFYDEPFAGQDPISMGVLVKLIRTLNDTMGLTSLVVTHDIDEVMTIADHVVVLSGTQVIFSDSVEALRATQDPWLLQFIHRAADGPVPFHYPAEDYQQSLLSKEAIV